MRVFMHRENFNIAYSEFNISSHEWAEIPENVSFVALRLSDLIPFFFVGGAVDESKYKLIWERSQ